MSPQCVNRGDGYTIPLHEMPGTDCVCVALIAIPDGTLLTELATRTAIRWSRTHPNDETRHRISALTMLNVYATDAAPLGSIVSVGGPSGVPGQDVVPAAGGTNFHETTIAGRRAAFADGQFGQRLLYVEVDGHWVAMTSRNTSDETLTNLTAAVVRNPDGSAVVPSEGLVDGLTLVLSATAPMDELYVGSNFAGIDYASPDGRSLGLRVYEPTPSSRAMLGLQAPFRATKIAGDDGFVGNWFGLPVRSWAAVARSASSPAIRTRQHCGSRPTRAIDSHSPCTTFLGPTGFALLSSPWPVVAGRRPLK